MTFQEALKEYKEKNNLMWSDLSAITGMSLYRLGTIGNGGECSDIAVKKISDAMGGVFEEYVNYKVCPVCGKEFIGKLKTSICCCAKCASIKNSMLSKEIKKETLAFRLKRERETRGMTFRQFGEFMEIHYTTLIKLEESNEYTPFMARRIYNKLGRPFKRYLIDFKCEHCRKVFEPKHGAQKYCCDDCAKQAADEQKRKTSEFEREKIMRMEPERIKTIPEFMAGRSYGDAQREMLLMKQKEQRMRV